MTDAANSFPYPLPEYGAEAFWDACNEERLVMQQCRDCGTYRWHPAPVCGNCGSLNYEWVTLSGRGKVHTWSVVTHPVHPAAVKKVPYVVVVVELAEQEGLTMISNLIGSEPDNIAFGQAVEVVFESHPSGQKLPQFRAISG